MGDPGTTPLWVPLVASSVPASAAVISVVVTAYLTSRREHAQHRELASDAALQELATAAVRLRRAALTASRTREPAPTVAAELDEAYALFKLRTAVVASPLVRDRALDWRAVALKYLSGDPLVDVAQERTTWDALLDAIGMTLRPDE